MLVHHHWALLCTWCSVVAATDNRRGRAARDAHHLIYCTPEDNACKAPTSEIWREPDVDIHCERNPCGAHAYCFLESCLCHPGYSGERCDVRPPLAHVNPWFTSPCPNLLQDITYDADFPISLLGGEYMQPDACSGVSDTGFCSYLCYGHKEYGVAAVPKALWVAAQKAESRLWQQVGHRNGEISNDRAEEHWAAFNSFNCLKALSKSGSLGRVMEVGAGPWTQIKGILYKRPDLTIDELTIWEPGAQKYINTVPTCSYKSNRLEKFNSGGFHDFPVIINSAGGELLSKDDTAGGYDVVVSINVVEHVQDAFNYLTGLYASVKKGGILIFHERYYNSAPEITNGDKYHPVRVKQSVFDILLHPSLFHVIYNNCTAKYEQREGEKGYYIIAVKK